MEKSVLRGKRMRSKNLKRKLRAKTSPAPRLLRVTKLGKAILFTLPVESAITPCHGDCPGLGNVGNSNFENRIMSG